MDMDSITVSLRINVKLGSILLSKDARNAQTIALLATWMLRTVLLVDQAKSLNKYQRIIK
jgi:hypothetical protein